MELKNMGIAYSEKFKQQVISLLSEYALIKEALEQELPVLGECLETVSEITLTGKELLFVLDNPDSPEATALKRKAKKAVEAKILHKQWMVELVENGYPLNHQLIETE